MDDLSIPEGSRGTVTTVVKEVSRAFNSGTAWLPKKKVIVRPNRQLITKGSPEEQIVADVMEQGGSVKQATSQLNERLKAEGKLLRGKSHVGETAVYNAVKRANPVSTPILDSPQGSDNDVDWAHARLFWVSQLQIRLGRITGVEATEFCYGVSIKDESMVPPFFKEDLLGRIDSDAITYFDETHKKTQIGAKGHCAKGARTQHRFRRDSNGALDDAGGLAPRQAAKKVKYPYESRFLLGCAKTKNDDGENVGMRLPPFDYSGKLVVSISDWRLAEQMEIHRVRQLPGDGAPWVTGQRGNNELWKLDLVSKVKGIKSATEAKLNAAGIHTVQDLMTTTATVDGISPTRLATFKDNAAHAKAGAFPPNRVKNHKLAANPYLSLYGRDQWKERIAVTGALNSKVCITKLVMHMVNESTALFKGTAHENTWMMMHDSLSLMTSKECRHWMSTVELVGAHRSQTRTVLDTWILPQQGLNIGTAYTFKPPGNST